METNQPGSRIEQFRKMAEADPTNELGHFSLGREYVNAQMWNEAVGPLQKVLELNPNISKAYHYLAMALLKLDRQPEAIDMLTRGVNVADERGDMMPRNDMAKLLQELGAPVPESNRPAQTQAVGADQVLCNRCHKVGPKLPSPPFSNQQGKEIQEKICAPCWREWIGMGTKVINELRLPLSDPQAQKIFDQHMREFLNLD